ncbi:uncharacterized protein LOC135835565 [Planococcus citri]|uniref:uncharacterized protein LOC135835565 n=1 Tax=Planococcus citri TaxID=170843 RepID=UPI0031FA449E
MLREIREPLKFSSDKMNDELSDVEMYQISCFDLKRPENSHQEYNTESVLKYLSSKEDLIGYDSEEELIFYPQLHGMCDRHPSECNCLSGENPDVVKKIKDYIKRVTGPNKRHPILNFAYEYNFVEIYLDNLHLEDKVPEEIFLCKNLKLLSLKGNNLERLSASVGGLKNLETLYLSNNNLTDDSIPNTLSFCEKLRTLYLDNNRILRLPGFLLKMKYLWILKRDGIDVTSRITMNVIKNLNRIEKIQPVDELESKSRSGRISTLQKLASHVILADKVNPFLLKKSRRDIILRYYWDCPTCDMCNTTKFQDSGYYVHTYLYGYLGDYLSIFTNKTCSISCAEKIPEPKNNDRLAFMNRFSNVMIRSYCSKLNLVQSVDANEKENPVKTKKKFPCIKCCAIM